MGGLTATAFTLAQHGIADPVWMAVVLASQVQHAAGHVDTVDFGEVFGERLRQSADAAAKVQCSPALQVGDGRRDPLEYPVDLALTGSKEVCGIPSAAAACRSRMSVCASRAPLGPAQE